MRVVVTFDGFVEVVPVFPRRDVGRLVLSPPQKDALILRAAGKVLSVVAVIKQEKNLYRTCGGGYREISYF